MPPHCGTGKTPSLSYRNRYRRRSRLGAQAVGRTIRCDTWCYTFVVPTTRPRHPVTETDEIADVLDAAAQRWSDVPRAKLVQLVLLDWARGGRSPAARADARADLAGSLPGSAALYDRTEDWPA